jgi:alpha-beta hydrolase superfamily lysophospholipase
MLHATGAFRGAGGLDLFYQRWRSVEAPVAALILVHGFGEHSGRYTNVVDRLAPCGYAIYSFDLRGHGRSPGPRGHINTWAEFRQDVAAFVRLVTQLESACPMFLMGHSLGGLIVLDYVIRSPGGLRGVIASGPVLGEVGLSPLLFALSRVVSRVWPGFSMDTRLDASAISRDPKVVQAYRDDPLVHGLGSARLGTETTAARKWVLAHAGDLRLPFLLIQGGADRLVDPRGSQAFFERVASTDKEYRVYEDACHEVHNDICAPQMLADLERWLEQHP